MPKPYKPYLRGTAEANDLVVGCKATNSDYEGPAASVTYDKDWLHIVTDEYEGAAMLNIETLPVLRRALSKVAKHIKASDAALSKAGATI